MNSAFGLCTSISRTCRQPSRMGDSLDSPPRGWYSIGNSRIVEPLPSTARITISEANSIPVDAQVEARERVPAHGAHPAVGVA